jgi:mono/diheme cytochrome c family protein
MMVKAASHCLVYSLLASGLGAETKSNSVDHRAILEKLDDSAFSRGQAIYDNLCINCHGGDGKTPTLPIARAFGKGDLKFGTDPYSMFLTLTKGNGLMGPQTWMTPQERYDVIHYVREKFMQPMQPKYVPVTKEYLAGLPTVNAAAVVTRQVERDFGPALASQLGRDLSSVLTVKLGDGHAISYNLHTMDQAGLWKGGFLNLKGTQHYRERGESVPEIEGQIIEGLQTWRWAHDENFDYPKWENHPRGPMPEKWMKYDGHYLQGDRVALSYFINKREIIEIPGKAEGFGAIIQTLRVGPGTRPLKLAVAKLGNDDAGRGFLGFMAPTVKLVPQAKENIRKMAVTQIQEEDKPHQFTAAAALGQTEGMSWDFDDQGRTVLTIPASKKSRLFQVVRHAGQNDSRLLSFAGYLNHLKAKDRLPDPEKLLHGGKLRWPEVISTKGKLSESKGAYVLDELALPVKKPGKVWLRTSALAFFPDGRMAVCTHGGDVWIVSGVDESLANLKWKRFASGMYEPFGLQVVDGLICHLQGSPHPTP